MSRLAELIKRVGETGPHDNDDFDIDDCVSFADFFNNGGLEMTNGEYNFAIVYAALYDGGQVDIGAWAWSVYESFDKDATFEVYTEDDFSASEVNIITDKINEIYGSKW